MAEGDLVTVYHILHMPPDFEEKVFFLSEKELYANYKRYLADFTEQGGKVLEELTMQEFNQFLTSMGKYIPEYRDVLNQLRQGYNPSENKPSLIEHLEKYSAEKVRGDFPKF